MSDTYRIVLTGGLEPGYQRKSVVEELIALFRISSEKAETLLCGSETIIKKDVDAGTAAKYEQAVRNAGAGCRLVADESSDSSGARSASAPVSGTERSSPGEGVERAAEPPVAPSSAAVTVSSPATAPVSSFSGTDDTGDLPPSVEPASQDPYAPPAASLLKEPLEGGVHEGRGVGAGRGFGWLVKGTKMFLQAPTAWVLVALVYMLLTIGGSLVPFVGPIAVSILFPVFIGGIMIGADHQQRGETLQFADLFSGFSQRPLQLAALGGVYLGGSIVIVLVVGGVMAAAIGGNALLLAQMAQEGANNAAITGTMVVGFIVFGLVMVGCLVPLYMALWFAPTLIALHDELGVWEALGLSYKGCLRNILGFLLYGIALSLMLFIAAIPFGLGLLVAGPILLTSIYASYREIFVE